uniref:beta-N-acetylhexosaminidase n=1 Tax=Dendroctonus ponderosae TaxID=77166 RepID=A0AAR5Q2S4_DENPD
MKGFALLIFALGSICVEAYIVNPGPKYVATKGAVWPKPQEQELFETFFTINPAAFKFVVDSSTCNILYNAVRRYEEIISNQRLSKLKKKQSKHIVAAPDDDDRYLGQIDQVQISLNEICDDTSYPAFQADESYSLNIAIEESTITARTVWGVLRGLETFSQLLYTGEDGSSTRVNATKIRDFPRFPVRGLLLDTSRHFIHLAQIYQLLDAMAYNKLNVFHWHIVDDQSFPYVSMKFPELSELGAYNSVEFVYAPDDIKAVIEYARQRGVRVIPEFDTPGHTRSWGVSHPELLTPCDDIEEGSFGPMDPTKDSTYSFIKELFSELRALFIDPFIHLGGDEVDFDCWELDASISSFMTRENIRNYSGLEGYYIQKVIDIADELNFNSIVWEEVFNNGVKLPNETIVHVWRDWEGNYWNDTMRSVSSKKFQLNH